MFQVLGMAGIDVMLRRSGVWTAVHVGRVVPQEDMMVPHALYRMLVMCVNICHVGVMLGCTAWFISIYLNN